MGFVHTWFIKERVKVLLLFYSISIKLCHFFFKACAIGWYGPDCKHQCSGHCRDNAVCNQVTGSCDASCAAGWHGLYCDKGEFRWYSITSLIEKRCFPKVQGDIDKLGKSIFFKHQNKSQILMIPKKLI